jgi:uncharacterized protein YbaR (Trm112 family)
MTEAILPLLRCPSSRLPLLLGTPGEVERLNASIAGGKFHNAGGRVVTESVEAVLVVADRRCAYLVRDGIPILLPEEAVRAPEV